MIVTSELNTVEAERSTLGCMAREFYVWHGNLLKIPRGDTNGVGEDEVTVTSS